MAACKNRWKIVVVWGMLFTVCLLLTISLSAQNVPQNPIKLEFSVTKSEKNHFHLTLGERGVLLIKQIKSHTKDSTLWDLTFYDTNLVKIRALTFSLALQVEPKLSHSTADHFYILFGNGQKRFNQKWVLMWGGKDQESIQDAYPDFRAVEPLLQEIYQISVLENQLILFGNDQKNCACRFENLRTGEVSQTVELGEEQPEFLYTDEAAAELYLCSPLYFKKQKTNRWQYQMQLFDAYGNIKKTEPFPQFEEYRYQSARMIKTAPRTYLIVGTYYQEVDQKASPYHSGVYTLVYKNGSMGYPNFFNYRSLQADSAKLKDVNLNLQLVVSNLFHNEEQYGLVTELFYPEYQTQYQNTYMPGGYYMTTPVQMFVGFRFLNAYVTTFDADGHLLWDHLLPLSNMLTQTLESKVKLHIDEDNNGYIYYLYGNTFTSTLVHNQYVLEPLLSENWFPFRKGYVLDANSKMRMESWYNNTFLLSGTQILRDKMDRRKNKRTVYVLSRMVYE